MARFPFGPARGTVDWRSGPCCNSGVSRCGLVLFNLFIYFQERSRKISISQRDIDVLIFLS